MAAGLRLPVTYPVEQLSHSAHFRDHLNPVGIFAVSHPTGLFWLLWWPRARRAAKHILEQQLTAQLARFRGEALTAVELQLPTGNLSRTDPLHKP
jgi:hypothetical protein